MRAEIPSFLSEESRGLEQIRKDYITVHPVSPDNPLFEEANKLVAKNYYPLARGMGLTEDDVYRDLCEDEYNQQSTTYIALHTNPEDYSQLSLAGTLRMVYGVDCPADQNEMAPIDAMGLLQPVNGNDWPHRKFTANDEEIPLGEYGRFTIAKEFRSKPAKDNGIPSHITGELVRATFDEVQQRDIDYVYAIMPDNVTNLVEQSGLKVTMVDDMKLSDNPKVQKIFDRYPKYWQSGSLPKLYMFDIPK